MSLSSPKVKVIGVIFQNNFGARYYAKYWVKHSSIVFGKAEYDLTGEAGQHKLEKAILAKVRKMNIIANIKPEQSISSSYVA